MNRRAIAFAGLVLLALAALAIGTSVAPDPAPTFTPVQLPTL